MQSCGVEAASFLNVQYQGQRSSCLSLRCYHKPDCLSSACDGTRNTELLQPLGPALERNHKVFLGSAGAEAGQEPSQWEDFSLEFARPFPLPLKTQEFNLC